jgi:hypothetical protein
VVREATVDEFVGSKLSEHIRYGVAHWEGLTRFLEDGRLELDTNPVENAIRPVCLTRKNALFAGHEVGTENWALLASIVATCRHCHVNPGAYVAEALKAIINGHPQSQIEELMPWRFRKASSQNLWGAGEALTHLSDPACESERLRSTRVPTRSALLGRVGEFDQA